MFPQFCENVGPTCEPNAGVWFYGNRCIGCHPVASTSVIFDLHKIAIDQLLIKGIGELHVQNRQR